MHSYRLAVGRGGDCAGVQTSERFHRHLGLCTKVLKPELVRFINGRGAGKVMWGTDFPLILHQESLEQIDALELKDEAKAKLLHETAAKLFKLD